MRTSRRCLVKATDLKLAKGEPSWFERTADHVPVMQRCFCRDFGSTLPLVNGAGQGAKVLYAGRLDDASWYCREPRLLRQERTASDVLCQ